MFDHVGPNVRDYERSRAFYEQALAPLGWSVLAEWPDHGVAGFGDQGQPVFWLHQREPYTTGMHLAFTCEDRATVDAFHAAGLAAGGRTTAPPGCVVPRELLRRVRARSRRQQRRGRLPQAGIDSRACPGTS